MITSFAFKAQCLLLLLLFSLGSKSQITAKFSATPVNGCAPLLVRFTDQSTGNPSSWKWDLGNGTISYLQNPSVSYFNPGYYTIKLVVKNGADSDSIVKTQFINVSGRPNVQFTANITAGCSPLPVQFTDQSIGGSDSISTWQWDFGDGFSSNQKNPLHIYTTSGIYNATLRVFNSKGCLNTLSKAQYIRIHAGVTANFSNSVPKVCSAPVTINFNNLSSGTGALTYKWLFGDGAGSNLPNPSHTYNTPGSYTVKLITTNASGCSDTLIKANAFTVGNVSPAFISKDTVCVGTPLVITNSSNPIPFSVTWRFGDGTSSTEISPVKLYSIPGNYPIKLIANFGSCLDSTFKTITVIPKPVAAFATGDSTNCRFPFAVNFTNNSIDAASYQWDFGDNTTSTSANPSHTYNSYGEFTVQLVVTGSNGCTDTIRKINAIRINKPVVVLRNLPDSGCLPFTKYFTGTITAPDPVTNYLWDFGDGATSANATPTHTFTSPGIFTIKLMITTAGGCMDTATMIRGIVTNNMPVAIMNATPRDACAHIPIEFSDVSTGNVINWLWDFGDGSKSTLQNPKHVYNDTGYYDVQLIVWNSGCTDTLINKNYIHVKPPIARFSASYDCSMPMERVFTNRSIGADEWNWDFGDGKTSTQFSPVHTYDLPGSYTVFLQVRNHATGCDFTTKLPIDVLIEKATFHASDTIVCKGTNITFSTNLSLSFIKSFEWDFGDGVVINTTSSNAATHAYTAAGTYSVRLIITDILGCRDTLIKSTYIRVDGPTAKFTSSVPGTCLDSLVIFTDASVSDNSHPLQSWTWNYGDGKTEILTAPPTQHTYSTSGAYIVRLKVTDSKGCADSFAISTALIISKPAAQFTPLNLATCPSKQVGFSNQSTGPGLRYLWNFGDDSTSTLSNPVHSYLADGTYSIKLMVTDQYGCKDSITRPGIISVVTPVANFSMTDSFSICPPLIVQFTNLSTGGDSQNWDFGDNSSTSIFQPSHLYNYPGNYTVTLTVTGKGGCISVMKKKIVVNGPRGTFRYDPLVGCNPTTIHFEASTLGRTSFIWDFNDGSTVATTDSVISHTYSTPGFYLPKMILLDSNGCQVPILGKDTIKIYGINAKFNLSDMPVCDSGTVSFIDSSISNDIITGYTWSMGDGKTSTLPNPQHKYISTGVYHPKLIVKTLNGCLDTMKSPIPVKVVASPQINISGTPNGCSPLKVTLLGIENVPDTSSLKWDWTFGNGNISHLQNPAIQNYLTAGIYTTSLVVTNSSGCKDTATKIIEAFSIPAVDAGQDTTICNRVGIILKPTGAANYNWSPSAGLSCINCANPVATPDSAKIYIVKGTSLQGCSAIDSILVKVQYPFKIKYNKADTLCKGQTVKLFATGADRYQWSPASSLNNSNIAFPVGNPVNTTTYRVVGTDYLGCFKDTGSVFVKVYPIPTVNAGDDKIINIGQSIDLVPVISPDVTVVTWSPTGDIFRNVYPAISVKPNQNTDYTVEVKNPGGCLARDQVSVRVLCNGANVFIPNTFSPNGDGANDIFYPRGTGLFKIKTFRIFNRWGEQIFEKSSFNANDPASGWDGTYKGAKLGSDVFVYMIDVICDNNTVLNYKGNVTLLQ